MFVTQRIPRNGDHAQGLAPHVRETRHEPLQQPPTFHSSRTFGPFASRPPAGWSPTGTHSAREGELAADRRAALSVVCGANQWTDRPNERATRS